MKRIDFRDLQKYLHKIPNQFHSDELLKKIHSMDAHTAYALLGGYLAPLLSAPTKVTIAPKPLHLETIVRANVAQVAHGSLKDIKSKIPSELPEMEAKMKEILKKLKEYYKNLPKIGHYIDADGHYKLKKQDKGGGVIFDIYEDLFELIQELRDFVKEQPIEGWELHPELRKKYNEILSLFSLVVPPWHWEKSISEHWIGILPPEATKFLIKDLEDTIKNIYKSRKEEEDRAIKDLQDRLDKLTKNKDEQIRDLDKQIKDLTKNEKNNKERITDLEKKLRDLEASKDSKISEKDREIANLKNQITDLTNEKNANKTTIKNLRDQITALQKKVTDLTTTKTQNESTIQSLRDQIKTLQKNVADLTKDKTRNEKTIEELNKQIEKLKKQVTDLTGNKTGNEKTIGELNKELKELREKVTDLEGKEGENTATIDILNRKIADLENDKTQRDTQIADLQRELEDAKNELTTVTTAKDAAIAELSRQIAEKNTQIANLQEEIIQLKEKVKAKEALEQQLIELQKEKDALERDKSGQITNLKEKLEALNERMKELEKLRKKEIDDLKETLKEVKDQLKIKEKEIKDTKIDEMGKELPDLQKVLKELEDGGIDLKDLSKLRDKLDDLNRLTKDGKDAVKDLEDLQRDIKALRDELKRQKEIELERKQKEKEISDREDKLDDLQRKILGLREELKNLESLKGKDLTNLREKLEKLEKLQKEVGDSKDKVKALEDEVNKLNRELKKDKQEEIDRQKEISDREKEIERKKKEEEINKLKEIELEELRKKQGMMDAYVFMIVVFLTQLHTKQAEKLKAEGEVLKKISQIFDQWNVIQGELNTISQNASTILRWIKERKVDSNYNLYTDSSLSKKETDRGKLAIWNTFKSFLPNLQNNVKKLRRILDEVRRDLPDSSKTLLDTIYKLSGKLLDIPDVKDKNDLTSYLKVTTQSEGEISISQEIEDLKTANKNLLKDADKLTDEMAAIRDDIGEIRWNLTDGALKFFWPSYYEKKRGWNEKRSERSKLYTQIDDNEKRIQEKESELRKEIRQKIALPDKSLTILEWISDSDQTQFKAYMDNIAQGVTALTSVSNMAQQQLQIDTQYYNSLLGLQKGGMDSLTKTIQGIIANMRS